MRLLCCGPISRLAGLIRFEERVKNWAIFLSRRLLVDFRQGLQLSEFLLARVDATEKKAR